MYQASTHLYLWLTVVSVLVCGRVIQCVKQDARQQQKGTLHILMVGVRIWHKQYENTVQAGAVGNIFLAHLSPK